MPPCGGGMEIKMSIMPTEKQKRFLDWELGVFFHFGIRTFNTMLDSEKKHQNPETFNPTNLDCEQWISTIKEAGAKYAVFTAKHHDGFAMWPSKFTDYSIKKSPWKNGKGDVVREFVDACRKYDIKVGIYYNPSQWGMEEMNNDEYNDYVINQASELLSGYGNIDYIWFDGAGSESHTYDVPRLVNTIRTLQPGIMIFNMWDPDTRWIGNEASLAPMYNSNIVNNLHVSIYTDNKDELSDKKFLPGECDCLMTGDGWNWFYDDNARVKSVKELMGMYMYSVGRGSNMLINISPDREGKICDEHRKLFLEFGENIRSLYKNPVAGMEDVEYEKNEYIVTLPKSALINTVILEEEYSEKFIEHFSIGICPKYNNLYHRAFIGETVGHKRICKFPPLYCDKVKITTDETEDSKLLKNITVTYTD